MKYRNILFTIALGSLSLLSFKMYGQNRDEMSKDEIARMDSVESATLKAERTQNTKDENRMADFKQDRKQTRAKAKDAQRVERDASAAARESRTAVRSERKAQKSRKAANRQAEKASKAREKSDNN